MRFHHPSWHRALTSSTWWVMLPQSWEFWSHPSPPVLLQQGSDNINLWIYNSNAESLQRRNLVGKWEISTNQSEQIRGLFRNDRRLSKLTNLSPPSSEYLKGIKLQNPESFHQYLEEKWLIVGLYFQTNYI